MALVVSDCSQERKRDRCSIRRVWQWTGKFAGLRLRVGLACGETQEEHVWNVILRRSNVDDHGASGLPNFNKKYSICVHK